MNSGFRQFDYLVARELFNSRWEEFDIYSDVPDEDRGAFADWLQPKDQSQVATLKLFKWRGNVPMYHSDIYAALMLLKYVNTRVFSKRQTFTERLNHYCSNDLTFLSPINICRAVNDTFALGHSF